MKRFSQKLQCSMYQMSPRIRPSISFSSLVSPRKPVTWLQPVMPGFTKWRTMYWLISWEYSSVCFSMCGREPTMLISPRQQVVEDEISQFDKKHHQVAIAVGLRFHDNSS